MAGIRSKVDRFFDGLRFRVDTFPSLDYQPLPWLGKNTARRAAGTMSRWETIRPILEQHHALTLVDVGSNVGWFSLNAADAGLTVVAVEVLGKFYRPLLHAIDRTQKSNVGVLVMGVDSDTVQMLPYADAYLFLSVWHHLVRYEGFDSATEVLREIWGRTKAVMFFETGENEMPERFGLPAFEPDPKSWLETYLEESCDDAMVRHLGLHDAFAPDGTVCQRNLFVVERRSRASDS